MLMIVPGFTSSSGPTPDACHKAASQAKARACQKMANPGTISEVNALVRAAFELALDYRLACAPY